MPLRSSWKRVHKPAAGCTAGQLLTRLTRLTNRSRWFLFLWCPWTKVETERIVEYDIIIT